MSIQEHYADQVSLQVRFRAGLGAVDEDESWDLVFHPESSWNEQEFTARLREISAEIGGGCCGSRFQLDTRRSEIVWGPSAAVTALVLTLAAEGLKAGIGATLKPVARTAIARMSEGRAPLEGMLSLDESTACSFAMSAVDRRLGDSQTKLSVVKVASPKDGSFEVVLEADGFGVRFTVQVELVDGVVPLCRIVSTATD